MSVATFKECLKWLSGPDTEKIVRISREYREICDILKTLDHGSDPRTSRIDENGEVVQNRVRRSGGSS